MRKGFGFGLLGIALEARCSSVQSPSPGIPGLGQDLEQVLAFQVSARTWIKYVRIFMWLTKTTATKELKASMLAELRVLHR